MNTTDRNIIDRVKVKLFYDLFGIVACHDKLEWHHQTEKDKNVSECGNIREALNEIKGKNCVPIPTLLHQKIHAKTGNNPFDLGIRYDFNDFNIIAQKSILEEFGKQYNQHISVQIPLQIYDTIKQEGCAYEFSKSTTAKGNYCKQIKAKSIPTTTNWIDLFEILEII